MTVLRRVIELSSSFNDGPHSSKLSIRQLVPVQESLLRAVAASTATKEEEVSSGSAVTELTTTSFSTVSSSLNLSTITEHEEYDDGHMWPDESFSAESTTEHSIAHPHHSAASISQLVRELNKFKATSSLDDLSLCGEILLDGHGPASRRLLVLQFLVLPVQDCLKRVVSVLLPIVPWLLTPTPPAAADGTCTSPERVAESDHDVDNASASNEFLEACLDAVFFSSSLSPSAPGGWDSGGLDQCLDQLMQVTIKSRDHWVLACRILVRLCALDGKATSLDDPSNLEPGAESVPSRMNASIAQVVVQYALVGLEAAGSQLVPVEWILPSLHNDLLPLLKGRVDYLVPLWVHVWTCLEPPPDAPMDELPHFWMLQTSVLCSILPDLVHTSNLRLFLEQSEGSPNAGSDADEGLGDEDDIGDGSLPPLARGRPVQSPVLWSLIHTCLMQGLYVEKKQSWIQESWANETAQSILTIPFGTCQLLRRRAIYLLHVLVEGSSGFLDDGVSVLWRKYVMCCETTEMERSAHLVDQVWETMGEIGSELVDECPLGSTLKCPPSISWTWMYPLLARIMTSYEAPSLRKLCLFRLFQGQAGILLHPQSPIDNESSYASRQKKPSKKSRTGNRPLQTTSGVMGASIGVVTPDFILDVVFASFDTLESASGSQMHVEEDRKEVRHDMYQLLGAFLDAYLQSIDDSKCELLFRGLWSKAVLGRLNRKTTVAVFASVADSLKQHPGFCIPTRRDMYSLITESLKDFFSLGSLIPTQQESILESVAVMLSRCHSATIEPLPPPVMLTILSLFPVTPREKPLELIDDAPVDERLEDFNHFQAWLEQDPIFGYLRQWISSVCGSNRAGWTSTTGAAIATAFVDGVLLPASSSSNQFQSWDPSVGCSALEKEIGQAVALFCTLACTFDNETAAGTTPASLLWPAISKGLTSNVTMLLASKSTWIKADVISRAIILLENGCMLRVISGLGNGDLVIDRKTQEMLSPPQNVETLVGLAVAFLVHHFRHLFRHKPGAAPFTESSVLLGTFIGLMSQLETLHKGYPSSTSIHQEVNTLLNDSLAKRPTRETSTATDAVVFIATVYASLACGGVLWGPDLLKYCKDLLDMHFPDFEQASASSSECKVYRCVFAYAKWASIAKLLPRAFESMSWMEIDAFVDGIVDEAIESVPTAPQEALVSIFHCVLVATKFGLEPSRERCQLSSDGNFSHVEKLIRSIVRVMNECKGSGNVAHMLDEAASLLFRPELLNEEAERFLSDHDSKMPLLEAFRQFVQLAGTKKHHILEAVLCRISVGWLGPSMRREATGIAAIPYLQEISSFLLYKEEKVEMVSMGQTEWRKFRTGDFTTIPLGTHDSSVARGFVLMFLSRLPDVDKGLPPRVMSELLSPLIRCLLDEVKPLKNATVSLGSADFIRKIRGWQALCVLSRFVEGDIAPFVSSKVFEAMGELLHNQIRYFLEVFAIQCSRRHPVVFGNELVEQITRTDLSLQHVSSLMIVCGNLVVGRYRDDFFRQFENQLQDGRITSLHMLLSGIIPWLGSTQGFSRAIAQLLVHRLIPMVADLSEGTGQGQSNWYLKSIYNFLDRNSEMTRLRSKQVAYFEQYDVDTVCTPKGILAIPVDDGGEALPPHAVDAMKATLREVFQEANSENTPSWKQLEVISQLHDDAPSGEPQSNSVINVQRKIIPIDSLNLALEDIKDMRQRNRAGRKKQKLIVCATFIDKVPNLGGLARTAEIFAAEKLVVPDLRVTKTDSFKSLSVSAGDWIDIEECKEENLLAWLRDRKQNGYYIVGLEQTSSSVSLCDFRFPDQPIVLLLGKEKEGIPVEFLQVVDQCVEIPQLGICRSLNVHVSGAVAIWEQTRQRIAHGTLADPSHSP